jgi:phosphorylcholine metabolism protein LicD
LCVSGIPHPIDFTHAIIDVLPVSILSDLNKLITLYKKEVQDSKLNPEKYTDSNIDTSRQEGFIAERYIYKNDSRLIEKIISSASKNRATINSNIVSYGSSEDLELEAL